MRDAAFTFDHPRIREGSPLRAHCLYRLTRKEWTEAGQAIGRWGPRFRTTPAAARRR
jgi:hypothetical protein